MKTNKPKPAIGILVLFLVLGGACYNQPTETKTGTVKIGAILTQTGSGAEIGSLVKRGLEIGVEDFNKESKGPKIEMIYEDSKTQPNDGLTAFNKLVSTNGVKIVVTQATVVCNAVGPAAESSKVLMFATNMTQKGFAKGKNYIIRYYPDASLSADTMADYVKAKYRRAAVIYLQNVYGQEAYQAFSKKYLGDGREIVFAEPVSPDATDLRTLITKMLAAKPDTVFIPVYGRVSVSLIQQLREATASLPIIGDVPLTNPTVYKPIGKAAEGIVLPGIPMEAGIARTPLQEAFIRDYVAKYGENPSISVAIHYDVAKLLGNAIANTDGSPEAVRKHIISQNKYDSLVADLRFDADGEALMELIPLKIEGGKLIPCETCRGPAIAVAGAK